MLPLFLLACAVPAPAPTVVTVVDCADAPVVTWDNWGHGFFRTWCGSCHSAGAQDRNGAPTTVSLDSRADVAAHLDTVRRRVLTEQTMPLGGGLSADDLRLLDVMLSCDF